MTMGSNHTSSKGIEGIIREAVGGPSGSGYLPSNGRVRLRYLALPPPGQYIPPHGFGGTTLLAVAYQKQTTPHPSFIREAIPVSILCISYAPYCAASRGIHLLF